MNASSNYDYIGHLAYLLVFGSFLLRDIIWLRIVAILAAATSVVYNFVAPPTPLWVPIQWNIALVSVNLFQIAAFMHDRRMGILTEKEKWLYQTIFKNFIPGDFRKLLALAEWKTSPAGTVLTEQDNPLRCMYLLFTGAGKVLVNGEPLAELEHGDLIGDMSFVTGHNATATISLTDESEYLVWDQEAVRKLMLKHPTLMAALQTSVGNQLARKISRTNSEKKQYVITPIPEDAA